MVTYAELAERLLREYAVEAGVDPFFATVGPPTAWRSCSTASTSCRCAATRSAATPPGCWRAC